ncbi:MAG: addiction module killer protein [Elusimicrobia bacterium]|nr:MAG: addiction module killer protein [Elusimicrobiota bacterium]KAF0155563.1 MAG: addiction module killer protein [Elusimicrobiota bacterium]
MQSQKRTVLHYVVGGKDIFGDWVKSLQDPVGRAVLRKRISRLKEGNLGDHHSLGAGLWELRVHYAKAHVFWESYRRLK